MNELFNNIPKTLPATKTENFKKNLQALISYIGEKWISIKKTFIEKEKLGKKKKKHTTLRPS